MTAAHPETPGAIRPIVHPLPLTVGDLVSGSFRAVFNRPGLYFGLTFLAVLMGSLVAAGPVAVLLSVDPQVDSASLVLPPWTDTALLASAALLVPALLVVVKVQAILSLAADQQVMAREPSFRALFTGTRHALPRAAVFMLLVSVGILAVAAVVVLLLVGGDGTPASRLAGFALVVPPLYIAAVVLGVRLQVAMPVIAVERRGATSALSRTWQLTRGAFWLTFGRLILFQVIASTVGAMVGFAAGVLVAATAPGDAALGQLATYAAVAAAQFLVLPYSTVYTALIYVDRRRRTDGHATATTAGVVPSPYDSNGYYKPGFGPQPVGQG